MKPSRRVVLDTNVALSALVFRGGALAWLRDAIVAAEIVPILSRHTLTEFVRVLSYPKLRLDRDQRETILATYVEHAQTLAEPRYRGPVPTCRDADDQKFLLLAYAAKAEALVSGEADLLALAGESRIPILTPAQFAERVR